MPRFPVTTVMLWITTLGFAGLKNPDAWAGANALFILGNLCECIRMGFQSALRQGEGVD